jgi:hypothetical protein
MSELMPVANTDDAGRVWDVVFVHGLGGNPREYDPWRSIRRRRCSHDYPIEWPKPFTARRFFKFGLD